MNTEQSTERGPLSWMLECERCEKAFVSPIRGPRRGDPCPACGGDVITLGAGYPTRDADGAIVAMDPVSMLSREVAEAVTEGIVRVNPSPPRAMLSGAEARRLRREQRRGIITIGAKPLPKAKKRSGKSPTRKVVPVHRSGR